MLIRAWLVGLLLLIGSAPAAQQFRAGVDVVTLDVVVTGRDGRAVTGLPRDSFEVLEDGVAVEVASFEAIQLPASAAPQPLADVSPGASIATNQFAPDGRLVVIVLDDVAMSQDLGHFARAKLIATALIEGMGGGDQAALITTSGSRQLHVDFTTDRQRLMASVAKWRPGPGLAWSEQRLRARWDTLLALARHLELAERRTAIALISEGLVLDPAPSSQSFPLAMRLMRDFFRTAQEGNLAVYPFDPGRPDAVDASIFSQAETALARTSRLRRSDELATIAINTGGRATFSTNALEDAVGRMLADTASYYRISFYARAARDGRDHAVEVRVPTPGAVVHTRSTYRAPDPGAADSGPDGAPSDDSAEALARALLPFPGIPLSTVATPVPAAAPAGSAIVVLTEFESGSIAGCGEIELVAMAVDDDANVVAQDRFAATFPGTANGDARRLRVASRLDVKPGSHQIRVALHCASSPTEGTTRRGSVFTEVDVPDFERGLQLGGLVIGMSSLKGVSGAAQIEDVFCCAPLARRDIPSGLPVIAVLPLRSSPGSEPVRFVATLRSPDGGTADLSSLGRASASFSGPEGGVYAVPVSAEMSPGAYTLTIDVTQAGRRVGAASRSTDR